MLAEAAVVLLGLTAVWWGRRECQRRGLSPWLGSYLRQWRRYRLPDAAQPVHLLLCLADHFEPHAGHVSPRQALARVEHWRRTYPQRLGSFRDSDGRPPRHTFFYPMEAYQAEHLEQLTELCRQGYGEVEIHLHHQEDTADSLRQKLLQAKQLLAERHGLLAHVPQSGEVRYGFIHGNWALCNSRPDGRWCGVNEELSVLRQTGCYADFTLPAAPHPAQVAKINSIYYAWDRPGRPRSHEKGLDVGTGKPPAQSLMLIQGPLLLSWRRRRWYWRPCLENGCIQASQPPEPARLFAWLRARIQVPQRPDWFFVKLHCHGAPEESWEVLLGEAMQRWHAFLAEYACQNPQFYYHYLTAREMYNLVRAAEAGWQGPVAPARDFELRWNGDRQAGAARSAGDAPVSSCLPGQGEL